MLDDRPPTKDMTSSTVGIPSISGHISSSSLSPSPSSTSSHKHHRSTASASSIPVIDYYSTRTSVSPPKQSVPSLLPTSNAPLLKPPPSLSDLMADGGGSNPQSSLRSPSPMSSKRSSWYGDGSDSINNSIYPIQLSPLLPPPSINRRSSPSPVNQHQHQFPLGNSSPTMDTKFVIPPRSLSPLKSLSPPKQQPFNFESKTVLPPSPSIATTPGSAKANQRRGHRYKHSSVSINFFQEPPPRAPLAIPASLPIPNFMEWRQSISKEQRIRLAWCACHVFAAVLVYNCNVPFTALSALAHLLLYDAMGATLCAAVDILGNFDVWKQSSIHHPFGLERIEVLAGFALSVFLIFMGGDIMSHVVQELVQSVYSSSSSFHGHAHEHGRAVHSHGSGLNLDDINEEALNWASVVFRVMLGILATVVSAVGLDNHSRISRTMHRDLETTTAAIFAWIPLPSILSNPSHLMTLTFSIAILLFPLLGSSGYVFVDALLTPLIAGSMCYVGWLHSKALAGMLIMSYSGDDPIENIGEQIRQDPLVLSVSDISLWQVHHELWLASVKIVMSGTDEDERRLRERATAIIRTTMGEDELSRWETTVDITRTTLD